MIEFQNVYKSFKDKHVLEDINFTVNDGEFVCLIGPSGCGKTTALKMINRLIKPSQGTIYVNGKDISEENEIELRRNIGYVIQQTGLFPHMTVKENIELIPKLKNKNDKHLLEKEEMINKKHNEVSAKDEQKAVKEEKQAESKESQTAEDDEIERN